MTFKKQFGIGLLKIFLVLWIFIFLFWRAFQNDAVDQLIRSPKNGSFLFYGVLLNLMATVLTMIRWNWLVRIQKISLSYQSALRFGFIGYLFNLSPIGIVGGDAVKAYLLFRKEKSNSFSKSLPSELLSSDSSVRISEGSSKDYLSRNIASVIIDRVIGLYVMFLLGFITILTSGFVFFEQKEAKVAIATVFVLFIVSTIGLLVLFLPETGNHWRHKQIQKIPGVGSKLDSFLSIVQIYRSHPFLLGLSAGVTLLVHFLFSASLFCIAKGLYQNVPSFYDHLVIYPIANIGSMIPLSAGPLEYFLDLLYPLFSIENQAPFRIGYGMLVGVAFRLATLLVAAIGVLFYFASRDEVSFALNEMNQLPENDSNK
ncbi:MAG: lysylphosphatidylglycerol synthase transmembrane domain-containing protein [Planctomycetia bacterium]|nr:lysylphosphatidylglycerol synthase transmembrane domain-containing protein [Planctomycetia bacterium]